MAALASAGYKRRIQCLQTGVETRAKNRASITDSYRWAIQFGQWSVKDPVFRVYLASPRLAVGFCKANTFSEYRLSHYLYRTSQMWNGLRQLQSFKTEKKTRSLPLWQNLLTKDIPSNVKEAFHSNQKYRGSYLVMNPFWINEMCCFFFRRVKL